MVDFPAEFPQLATERLHLRALADGDAEAVFHNYSDPDVADTLSDNARSLKLLKRLGFRLHDMRGGSHYFSLSKEQ